MKNVKIEIQESIEQIFCGIGTASQSLILITADGITLDSFLYIKIRNINIYAKHTVFNPISH